jgi:hypothetical protein
LRLLSHGPALQQKFFRFLFVFNGAQESFAVPMPCRPQAGIVLPDFA